MIVALGIHVLNQVPNVIKGASGTSHQISNQFSTGKGASEK